MAGQHAKFAPSGADAWFLCPGKLAAEATLPEGERNRTNDAARAGSAGHAMIASELLGGDKIADFAGKEVYYDESGVEPPWIMDAELAVACTTCVNAVRDKIDGYEKDGFTVEMRVEMRVYPGLAISPPTEECWGSADVILFVYNTNGQLAHIEVIDHKLGSGVYVEEDSLQLQMYALGALILEKVYATPGSANGSDSAPPGLREWGPLQTITTTVIQPRHHRADSEDPARSKHWTRAEMLEFADNLSKAIAAASGPQAPRIPGDKQCQWCAYKGHCPELREYALTEASQVFTQLSPLMAPASEEALLDEQNWLRDPSTLSMDQLLRILDKIDLVRGWLNAVDAYAAGLARSMPVPGWKLVEGRGSYKWVSEEEIRKLLTHASRTKEHGGRKLAKKDFVEEKVISPAQARKQLKSQLSKATWEKVEGLISKNPGAPTLVRASDPRDPIRKPAREVFSATESATAEGPEPQGHDHNPLL